MNMLAKLLAIAVAASTGCAGELECAGRGHGGSYDECVSNNKPASRSERREAERREAEKRDQERRDEEGRRREYEAAKQACDRREPKGCANVALYGSLHQFPKAQIVAALEIACDGRLADSCFTLGILTNDVVRLASSCELGYRRACEVAATRDPSRAFEMDGHACELHDGFACERVARAQEQRGDRGEAEKYWRLACREGRKSACPQPRE